MRGTLSSVSEDMEQVQCWEPEAGVDSGSGDPDERRIQSKTKVVVEMRMKEWTRMK